MEKTNQKYGKELTLLLLIFLIGCFLRFYRLGDVPVGFHQDEAFFGYNAYSILKTGKDMTGNFFPIHLQSFWYSPGLYSYFAIPFISLFKLNPFSVRVPSALFGTFSIIAVYFLIKELFIKYKYRKLLALLTSFFLAINPWSINLSRTATENTIATFFIISGVLAYLYWNRINKTYLFILSFFLFFVSIFIYQAPRGFLPIFLPVLFLLVYKRIYFTKFFYSLALFAIVIVLPVVIILHSPKLSTRIKSLSIFTNPRSQLLLDESIREDGLMMQPVLVTRVFHNKLFSYSSDFLNNYFSHLSYNFFFSDQALPPRYKIPSMGLLYIFEFPLILLGTFFILKQKLKEGMFLIAWGTYITY